MGAVNVSALTVVILLTLEKHKHRVRRLPPSPALITAQPFRLLTDGFVCVNVRDSI